MSDPCEFCQKTFSTKGNLLKHIPKCKKNPGRVERITVEKERSFKCEFCGTMFITEHNLSKHKTEKCRYVIQILQTEVQRLQNVEKLLQESKVEIMELTKKIERLEGNIEVMKKPRTVNVQNNNIIQYKLCDLPITSKTFHR